MGIKNAAPSLAGRRRLRQLEAATGAGDLRVSKGLAAQPGAARSLRPPATPTTIHTPSRPGGAGGGALPSRAPRFGGGAAP
jgi:hypothetical protein